MGLGLHICYLEVRERARAERAHVRECAGDRDCEREQNDLGIIRVVRALVHHEKNSAISSGGY